ncbi:FkbM family methyltransferase [Pedobacter sp. UYP30]|uniref:FkbM family methyltransferase n=1 Tax=Pedobacter sp. UYP30 TaxID=1756400 RepID=UPI0033991D2E
MKKAILSILKNVATLSPKEQTELFFAMYQKLPCRNSEDVVVSEQLSNSVNDSQATAIMLGDFSRSIIVDSQNGLLNVDIRDQGVGLTLRNTGEYGTVELERILSIVDKSSSVLIVGAHVGALLIPIAKNVNKVTAFEANPDTFRLLEMNLKINNILNCECYNIAASDDDGKLSFLLNTVNSGGSKRKPIANKYMYIYDHPKEVSVDGKALDGFLGEQCFDLILMDIEGSEYFAMKGMQKILSLAKNLIFEFVPHHIRNVSGVSIDEFVKMLAAFDTMFWPLRNIKVAKVDFGYLLSYLYDQDICEDGIIMQKKSFS